MTRNNTSGNTDDSAKQCESLRKEGSAEQANQKILELDPGLTTYKVHKLWQVT